MAFLPVLCGTPDKVGEARRACLPNIDKSHFRVPRFLSVKLTVGWEAARSGAGQSGGLTSCDESADPAEMTTVQVEHDPGPGPSCIY